MHYDGGDITDLKLMVWTGKIGGEKKG